MGWGTFPTHKDERQGVNWHLQSHASGCLVLQLITVGQSLWECTPNFYNRVKVYHLPRLNVSACGHNGDLLIPLSNLYARKQQSPHFFLCFFPLALFGGISSGPVCQVTTSTPLISVLLLDKFSTLRENCTTKITHRGIYVELLDNGMCACMYGH